MCLPKSNKLDLTYDWNANFDKNPATKKLYGHAAHIDCFGYILKRESVVSYSHTQ